MNLAVLLLVGLLGGCMKPTTPLPSQAPAPQKAQKPPFEIDGLPPALTAGCFDDADGDGSACDRLDLLEDGQKTLQRLHRQQTIEMTAALEKVHSIMNRPANTPTVRLSANPLDTTAWVDPMGVYPATLVLRIEYSRGLDYLRGSDTVDELKTALYQAKRLAETQKIQWRKQKNKFPRNIVLPDDLTRERATVAVRFNFVDETLNMTLPDRLARKHLSRETVPWDAVVAHVSNKEIVQPHRLQLASPLMIKAGGSIEIVELSPSLDRREFVSRVTPQEACGLAGELRFVARDSTPPMRAKPQGVAQSGGGR